MNCKGSRKKRLHRHMSGVTERTHEESKLSPGRYLNIRCAKQSSTPFGSCFIRSSSETFNLFMETVHEMKLRWKPPEIWRHVDANLLLRYPRSLLLPSSGQRRIFPLLMRTLHYLPAALWRPQITQVQLACFSEVTLSLCKALRHMGEWR